MLTQLFFHACCVCCMIMRVYKKSNKWNACQPGLGACGASLSSPGRLVLSKLVRGGKQTTMNVSQMYMLKEIQIAPGELELDEGASASIACSRSVPASAWCCNLSASAARDALRASLASLGQSTLSSDTPHRRAASTQKGCISTEGLHQHKRAASAQKGCINTQRLHQHRRAASTQKGCINTEGLH